MDNKKISLAIAGAMLISLFLPFAKLGPIGVSIFDAITGGGQSAELIGITVLVVAFAVLTFMQNIYSLEYVLGLFYWHVCMEHIRWQTHNLQWDNSVQMLICSVYWELELIYCFYPQLQELFFQNLLVNMFEK